MSLHVFVAYLTGRGNLLLFTVEEIVIESLIKIYALLTETLNSSLFWHLFKVLCFLGFRLVFFVV